MVGARVSRPDLSGCPGEGRAAQVAIATMFHVEHSGAARHGAVRRVTRVWSMFHVERSAGGHRGGFALVDVSVDLRDHTLCQRHCRPKQGGCCRGLTLPTQDPAERVEVVGVCGIGRERSKHIGLREI